MQAQSPGMSQKETNDLVWTAVKTELAASEHDDSVFMYHDHDVKPGNDTYKLVIETTSNGTINRVYEKNGQKIPFDQQKGEVENFVNSPSLQQKQRQNGQHDGKQASDLLRMMPTAFLWTVEREDANFIYLSYKPNPNFNPPTMESRVFAGMAGEMVVSREQHRIKTFKGRLIRDITFGWGLFGRLNQGGTFDIEREQLEPHVWEITQTHVHINGHALFFKTIGDNEDDVESDFRPAPANLSLAAAAKIVLSQPE